MKKIIIPGLLAGLVMLAASWLFSMVYGMLLPDVAEEYKNEDVFRPWSDPRMLLFFINPFLMGVIIAWIWDKVKPLFAGASQSAWYKLGLSLWVLGVPGLFITYGSFQLSGMIVIGWILGGLVEYLVGALVVTQMNKAVQ